MYVTHERTVKRYKMIGYLGLPLRTYYGTLKKRYLILGSPALLTST